MGIIKRAGDLVYTFRFLKLLVTDFEDTDAYKAGIITADGKRDKSYDLMLLVIRINGIIHILHFIDSSLM
jgi:hypothetical protein